MPTYDYNCSKCKATYEVREGFDAPTTHTCQECGKGTAKRLLTAPRIVFKGSGWYVTDSRSKTSATSDTADSSSGSGDSKSESKAETKSEAKSEAKTESKPAAKSETKSSGDSVASAAS